MREKACCFTGHRDLSLSDRDIIERRLEPTLIRLIESGVCFFGAGGALGADTCFELTVLKLKHRYPHIKLILVLPCRSQTRGWKEEDIRVYEEIKSKADKVVYTSEGPQMAPRGVCLVYWNRYPRSCSECRNAMK